MKNGILFSLRQKLLLFFILILIVPLLLSGYFIYNRYSSYLVSKEISISKQTVNEISGKLNDYLWQLEQLSFDVSFNGTIQDMLRDFNPNRFVGPRVEAKVFQNLFGVNRLDNNKVFYLKITNSNDEIALSVGNDPREETGFDDCFLKNSSLRVLWSNPRDIKTFSDNTNVFKIISLYRWIWDSNYGIPIGTVRVDVDSSSFNNLLSEYNYLSNSSMLIIDKNGIIIAGSDEQSIGKSIFSLYNLKINTLFDKNISSSLIKIKNSWYYVISSNLAINGWEVIHIIPSSSIDAQASSIKQYIFLVAIICVSFSLLLSIIISFLVTRPLNRMIKVIRKVRDGYLDVVFDITTHDEFALLGISFNEMTANIKDLIHKNAEIQKQENIAELLYLQSQINPHFLYNTLDSIRWTARRNRDIQVSKQVEMLSNMFRYYLSANSEYVTFEKEIEHIKNYLEIQKFRFKEKITFNLQFESGLMNLYTIKLVLQPLVENSIVHGLENKLENGFLSISGNIINDIVLITVEDNGLGTDQFLIMQQLNSKVEEKKVFALKNINDRLKLHFGERFGIKFNSIPGHGTRVSLKLPILSHIPKQEEII